MTEKQFLADVLRLARLRGWMAYHTRDSRGSAPGFPDLVLLRPGTVNGGRLLVAELKVGGNHATGAQDQWLRAFRLAGVPAFLWRPEDWARIEDLLE